MVVDTGDYLALIHTLIGGSAAERERAADEATDSVNSYSREQAVTLVHILLWLAQLETSPDTVEAELNAASAIVETGLVGSECLTPIGGIDRTKLPGSAIEHYEYLIGESEALV